MVHPQIPNALMPVTFCYFLQGNNAGKKHNYYQSKFFKQIGQQALTNIRIVFWPINIHLKKYGKSYWHTPKFICTVHYRVVYTLLFNPKQGGLISDFLITFNYKTVSFEW